MSGEHYCPDCGDMSCPICGSKVKVLEYKGNKAELLALMKRDDFSGFVGCTRVELHDKVVDGVNYRGKVFVRPISR